MKWTEEAMCIPLSFLRCRQVENGMSLIEMISVLSQSHVSRRGSSGMSQWARFSRPATKGRIHQDRTFSRRPSEPSAASSSDEGILVKVTRSQRLTIGKLGTDKNPILMTVSDGSNKRSKMNMQKCEWNQSSHWISSEVRRPWTVISSVYCKNDHHKR